AAVVADGVRVARRGTVQLEALEQHAAHAVHRRAVRVERLVSVCMVAAVHRHPLLGDRPGAEPQPEAERVAQGGMQDEAAMGLIAVQVECHPEEHGLDGEERNQEIAPHGQLDQAIGRKTHPRVLRGLLRESGAEAYGKSVTIWLISYLL